MKKILLALLMIVILGAPLCSQTLDEVLALNYQGRGGLDKLKSLAGWKLTGKIVVAAQELDMPVTIWQQRPDRMRVESTFQGKTIIQASDGRDAWWIMPFLSETAQEMPPEQGRLFREQADFESPLVVYRERGYALELLGREDLDNRPAFKLKLTKTGGREIVLFLDAGSGVELKSAQLLKMGENEALVEILYSDYRLVSGCLMPFAIENKLNGVSQMKMTFDAIEIDPVLAAAFFAKPANKEALAAGKKK